MSDYEKPRMSREELHRVQPPKKKKRHVWLWILLVFVIGAVGYGAFAYFQAKETADNAYDPNNAVATKSGEFGGNKPVSILLLGTDTGALGRTEKNGNTDTMIVATINPKTKTSSLISVPRDTMTEMVGGANFNVQKANAAYNIGGAKMAMDSVSKLMNIDLKYYVTLNMAGLQEIVDSVGGVDVDVPFDFSYGGSSFKKGKMHLDGKAALSYSRMRHEDPEGDYGRQKRQRQIIISIVNNAMSLHSVANYQKILNSLKGNIKTNLTFDNMVAIGMNYRSAAKSIKSDYLHGTNAYIGDASYQVMATKELQRISDLARKNMGLEPKALDNNETRQNRLNKNFIWTGTANVQTYTIYNRAGQVWDGRY